MENSSKIGGEIKVYLTPFSHKLLGDFKKPLRKYLVQMIYGIQASKDVKLSNIARSLNEEIPLIKTKSRLSRNLGRIDLTGRTNRNLIAEGGRFASEYAQTAWPVFLRVKMAASQLRLFFNPFPKVDAFSPFEAFYLRRLMTFVSYLPYRRGVACH